MSRDGRGTEISVDDGFYPTWYTEKTHFLPNPSAPDRLQTRPTRQRRNHGPTNTKSPLSRTSIPGSSVASLDWRGRKCGYGPCSRPQGILCHVGVVTPPRDGGPSPGVHRGTRGKVPEVRRSRSTVVRVSSTRSRQPASRRHRSSSTLSRSGRPWSLLMWGSTREVVTTDTAPRRRLVYRGRMNGFSLLRVPRTCRKQ